MRTVGASRTTAAFLWAAALISIFITGIWPAYEQSKQIRWRQWELSSREARNTAQRVRKIELVEELGKDLSAAQTVAFKFPGIEFHVPSAVAPLAWMAFALGLIWFLHHSRCDLLTRTGRGLRLLKEEPTLKGDPLVDLPTWTPFWLAPLPCRDGQSITADELRAALGWDQGWRYRRTLVTVILAAACVAQLWTAWACYVVSSAIQAPALRWIVSTATLLMGASVCLAIHWRFFPMHVPDHMAHEPPRFHPTRRWLLGYAAITASAFLVIPVWSLLRRPLLLTRRPRYRVAEPCRVTAVELAPGFYRHQKSNIVHRVTNTKAIRMACGIRGGQLAPVPAPDIAKLPGPQDAIPRAHLTTSSYDLETEALSQVQRKQFAVAGAILLAAVRHQSMRARVGAKVSYRVFDLLAALAVRHDQNENLNTMLSVIGGLKDSRLTQRAQKWRDWDGKWYRRHRESKRQRTWSGLPM